MHVFTPDEEKQKKSNFQLQLFPFITWSVLKPFLSILISVHMSFLFETFIDTKKVHLLPALSTSAQEWLRPQSHLSFQIPEPYPNQGEQILPTIAEVAANIFPWLCSWS